MVTNVSSFGRSGLYDWLIQRVSAVILLSYVICLVGFVLLSDTLNFSLWQGLFAQTWMKIFSLLALVSLCAHAWIGMWTISTDYFTQTMLGKAATTVRFTFQLICVLALFVYFVWGVQILWSV